MKGLKYWFLETRPQFLTLTVVLAFLGTVIAWYYDYFHLGHAVLAGVGLLFAHIYGVMHMIYSKEDVYKDVLHKDPASIETSALEIVEYYVRKGT